MVENILESRQYRYALGTAKHQKLNKTKSADANTGLD
jgi:hypothetical protein